MTRRRTRHVVAAIIALTMLAGACGDDDTVDLGESAPELEVDPATDPDGDGRSRDDVDCDAETLGEDDEFQFVGAYYVVDGELGERCFGDDDPTILAAWENLGTIADEASLSDLALFAGFVANDPDSESTTLAFVNVADDEGLAFQMSVNLDSYDEDLDEATLTMAHEFSHVFTATASQIDRSEESAGSCTTYDNGEGCFLPDSIMAQWIALFWDGGLIDGIDPSVEPDPADGDDRCATDASFLGAYAASNPEEDFAETFSAFVYRVDAPSDAVQEKYDWIADQPGLAEYRDRAEEAGVGPLTGNFEPCG